jgi:hypothetical protein
MFFQQSVAKMLLIKEPHLPKDQKALKGQPPLKPRHARYGNGEQAQQHLFKEAISFHSLVKYLQQAISIPEKSSSMPAL